MSRRRAAAAAVALALCGMAGPASADHLVRTADPALFEAIAVIARAHGGACEAGSEAHCDMASRIGLEAHVLLSAGYACRWQADGEACSVYEAGTGRVAGDLAGLHAGVLPFAEPPGWVPAEFADHDALQSWQREQADDLLKQLLAPPSPQLSPAEQHERFIEMLRE